MFAEPPAGGPRYCRQSPFPGGPPRALPTLMTCCCDGASFPRNLLLFSSGAEKSCQHPDSLLSASFAAAMISMLRATLISKSRSCDHINAAGHSYQQDPKLRSYQRFGRALTQIWPIMQTCPIIYQAGLHSWCGAFILTCQGGRARKV